MTGTIAIGGDLRVNRLGYGAMRLSAEGIWGDPADRDGAKRVLRRAVELGLDFIDTADAYGPATNESLIAIVPVIAALLVPGPTGYAV
jgi:pyridoxine 4-dehydrogenase